MCCGGSTQQPGSWPPLTIAARSSPLPWVAVASNVLTGVAAPKPAAQDETPAASSSSDFPWWLLVLVAWMIAAAGKR